jgi:ribosomal protein S18 acetylase RimI-like enzyme
MIRKATINDVSRIAEIQIYGWRFAYAKFLSEKKLYFDRQVIKSMKSHEKRIEEGNIDEFVYEDNEIIKGFMMMANSRDEDKKNAFELTVIYIEPYFKKQGIGTKMINYFEKVGREKNKKEFIVWVFDKNIEGKRFYEKNGYQHDGTRRNVEEYNEDEIRYEKVIV